VKPHSHDRQMAFAGIAAEKIVFVRRFDAARAQPLISFIVPVYDTRDTVLRTLDSIAAQPKCTEIIAVHDGGSDDSLAVVAHWARGVALDVTVLDQPNRGLSMARMVGVRHARGTFIAFLDSDDFINASVFQLMAEEALARSWDVAVCRSAVWDSARATTQVFYDWRIWQDLCGKRQITSTSIARSPSLLRLEPNANTKIIRREFFVQSGIEFPEGLFFEDLPAHFSVILKAARVGLINFTGYYYRVSRPGKITEERTHGVST
jgi:glycosyltransferase involved in cell wall biosynthesis